MKHAALVIALVAIVACKSKSDDKAAPAADPAAKPPTEAPKPAEPKPAEPKPEAKAPPAELVEIDLSAFGKPFAGYVAMAPATAKVEFDDPSRHITLSDTDFVSISEAPFWEDGVKGLNTDKDNSNIKQVSPTEVRYERHPPLGTAWNADVLVKVGSAKYSCSTGLTGTFTSADMADQIATICKSIHKKKK